MEQIAFQDQFPWMGARMCWGCGADNSEGLQIKSYWDGEETACIWEPKPYHLVGMRYLNGGVIATIMDCHCTCSAVAHAYRVEGREIGSGPSLLLVGGAVKVSFLKPAPIDHPVTMRARPKEIYEKKSIFTCELYSGSVLCSSGEFTLVRVPESWVD